MKFQLRNNFYSAVLILAVILLIWGGLAATLVWIAISELDTSISWAAIMCIRMLLTCRGPAEFRLRLFDNRSPAQ
jgi:hypothetical protein